VVEARIKSLLKSIALPKEVHPDEVVDESEYDMEAVKRLATWNADNYDVHLIKLFDVPDDAVNHVDVRVKLREYAEQIKFTTVRVAKTYAYRITSPVFIEDMPYLSIHYATSFNDYSRFEELKEQYSKFVESLNNMMWDSIQYIKYLYEYNRVEKPQQIVLNFYKKHSKYIHVHVIPPDELFDNYSITVYCPTVLKGLLIGRQGKTVKTLEEKLREELGTDVKVKIEGSEGLDEQYKVHLGLPPEAVKLIAKILPDLKFLKERFGITPKHLADIIEEMEKPEDDIDE